METHIEKPNDWKYPKRKDSVSNYIQNRDYVVHGAMRGASIRPEYPRFGHLALENKHEKAYKEVGCNHECKPSECDWLDMCWRNALEQ